MRYIVYALCCPRCGCPRYVGQTSDIDARIRSHLSGRKSSDGCRYKKHWVQSLLDSGTKPVIKILSQLPTEDFLDEAEIYWIAALRQRGCPLTNLTDGGGGLRGYKQSKETVKKRAAKLLGRPVSNHTRKLIAEKLTGRPSPKKGRALDEAQRKSHFESHAVEPFQDQHGGVYTSIVDAAAVTGANAANISNVLKRKRQSAGGFVFTFLHEIEMRAEEDRQKAAQLQAQKEATKTRNLARAREWRRANKDRIREYMAGWRKNKN